MTDEKLPILELIFERPDESNLNQNLDLIDFIMPAEAACDVGFEYFEEDVNQYDEPRVKWAEEGF